MKPRMNLGANPLARKILSHRVAVNQDVEEHLPVLTRELIKIPASQLNGCSYCLDMHTKDAAHADETPQRMPGGHYQPHWASRPHWASQPSDTSAVPA